MSDVVQVAVVAGTTTCIVAVTRVYLAVRLSAIRASIATNANEYAILERVVQKPRKVRAAKSSPVHTYGL